MMSILEAFAIGTALYWLFILGLPIYGSWLHDLLIGPVPPEKQRLSDAHSKDRETPPEKGPYR